MSLEASSIDQQVIDDTRYTCQGCSRSFRTKRGLIQHQRSCSTVQKVLPDHKSTRVQKDQNIEIQQPENQLQQPKPPVTYNWGKFDDTTYENNLVFVYERIVFWKRNLFVLPKGNAGEKYIEETTRLFNCWLTNSPLKPISFKAIMVMPSLLLQKPTKTSKAKDHLAALERRLGLWEAGEILELFKEAETIQQGLK